MAHYKRKRSRSTHSGYYSGRGLENRLREKYGSTHEGKPKVAGLKWYGNWPRWHDVVFHTAKHRTARSRAETAIMKGADPDAVIWPLQGKPHIYYW